MKVLKKLALCTLIALQPLHMAAYAPFYTLMNALHWGLITVPFGFAGVRRLLDLQEKPHYATQTERADYDSKIEVLGQSDDKEQRLYRYNRLLQYAADKHNVPFWQTAALFATPAMIATFTRLNSLAYPLTQQEKSIARACMRLPIASAKLAGGALFLAAFNAHLQQKVNAELPRLSYDDRAWAAKREQEDADRALQDFQDGGILSTVHDRLLPFVGSVMPHDMFKMVDTTLFKAVNALDPEQTKAYNDTYRNVMAQFPACYWFVAPDYAISTDRAQRLRVTLPAEDQE